MLERDLSRRRTPRRAVALLCAAGAFGAGAPALAQQESTPPQTAEIQSAPSEAGQRQVEEAQRELDAARRNLEQAMLELERNRQDDARGRAQVQLERAQVQVRNERERAALANAERAELERVRVEARAAADAERGELERARSELQAARRNLENAAREVAQLSARVVAPIVEEFQVQWLGAGQGAVLGLVVEDDADGARVTAVSPGGPADAAGARIDDVIVAVDGRTLTAPGRRPSRVLIERLSDVEPGTRIGLRVARDGTTEEMSVETREREARAFTFEAPRFEIFRNAFRPEGRWSSMELTPLTAGLGAYFGTESGLLVVRAPDDESLLLEDGDVILDIGGRAPNSPEHAMRILGTFEAGETVELTIMRRQQRQTLAIPLE